MFMGVHVSISGGLEKAVDRALERGCDVFQIFTRNPRSWSSKELTPKEADLFSEKLKSAGLGLAVAHMPYLPNLASPEEYVHNKSREMLIAELERCYHLGIPYLVTHLGSHMGTGWAKGLQQIILALEEAFSKSDNNVILLLENTSGSKNGMGSSFEDIAAIIDKLNSERLGICLDTCHLFAAGYELRTQTGLEDLLEQFDGLIGFRRMKLIHLNDSQGVKGSRIDRHEHIGLGQIGEPGFRIFLANDVIRCKPMILETPIDSRRDDIGNLEVARNLALNVF
ncbi:MAG: deoxyribonuclease IV [Methanotrichaceae archaeon]|nr:deoxyribonuclease IV [Methanotrichaceae archaeon]